MLDINKVQSTNEVTITGILSELNIEEKMTNDGRGYVQGLAKIKVDQSVSGKIVENEIPVRMFSMKKKSDGTDNAVYKGIVKMAEDYTSLAAAETPSQASRVTITHGQIQENSFISKDGILRTGFQISSNFMRKAKPEDEEQARFELSGVIGSNITDELNKEGEETGRILVKLIVVGYKGKVDVVTLIAENPVAVNHIRDNWDKGDTVSLAGVINMTYKVETWEEEQGWGEPIKRSKTTSKRELIITSGSPMGLDEDLSYDSDSIKLALEDRKNRLDELKNKKVTKPVKKFSTDFGF